VIDKRVIERQIRKGKLDAHAFQRTLEALPDMSDRVAREPIAREASPRETGPRDPAPREAAAEPVRSPDTVGGPAQPGYAAAEPASYAAREDVSDDGSDEDLDDESDDDSDEGSEQPVAQERQAAPQVVNEGEQEAPSDSQDTAPDAPASY